MLSSRPYLIRALYDWLIDSNVTPLILVDVENEGAVIPEGHADQGRIIFNLSPIAVRQLDLGNEWIRFGARFDGVSKEIKIPINAVLGIYAKENGQGMLFTQDQPQDPDDPEPGDDSDGSSPNQRPSLKVVK